MSDSYVVPQTDRMSNVISVHQEEKSACELSQRFFFDAAHTLNREIETEGSMRIHGHTYEAEVTVRGVPESKSGMVIDLGLLRSEISRVREMLDHRLLDEVAGLGSPTLENLCMFIKTKMEPTVSGLCQVMVERRTSGDKCVLRLSSY